MRIVVDHEYNQKETDLILQKEKEAKLVSWSVIIYYLNRNQFYDKIRQNSLEKNLKGLEFLQQSGDERRPGGGHLRSLIEKTRREKTKLEEDEERFHIDRQKHVCLTAKITYLNHWN